MKNSKKIVLIIGLVMGFNIFAQESQIDKICKPILEKKCATNDCGAVNSEEVLQGLFNKCQASVIDVDNLKRDGDVAILPVNSEVGYLVSFSNLISRALAGKTQADTYKRVKSDYIDLKKSYSQYNKKNQTEFLSSLVFLDKNPENKALKKRLLEEDKANKLKIKEKTDKLKFMLSSEKNLEKYKETHKKFVPAIIFEANTEKFKNKLFNSYECQFLEMNFDKQELKEFRQRLNYKCIK